MSKFDNMSVEELTDYIAERYGNYFTVGASPAAAKRADRLLRILASKTGETFEVAVGRVKVNVVGEDGDDE